MDPIIRIFHTQDFRSGGVAYESLVKDCFTKNARKITPIFLDKFLPISKGLRFQQLARLYFKNFKSNCIDIRTVLPTASLCFSSNPNNKNISIFHHHDVIGQPHPVTSEWIFQRFLEAARKYVHTVVVVSEFWKRYLTAKGVHNAKVIYNSFDVLDVTSITEVECASFRQKFGLQAKKFIYIGNNKKNKGVDVVYDILKKKLVANYMFVSTGRKEGGEPFTVLDLTYREYLTLLKLSECVVAFSLFKEGWNRTAHEAMLLKTPVVGSGLGGMNELLTKGRQIVCPEKLNLADAVKQAIANHEDMGEKGFQFTKQFDLDYFENAWLELINEVINE